MRKDYDWLNATSRLFLARGYLSPGESAEERIDIIANGAEQTLRYKMGGGKKAEDFFKGFADKLITFMKRGWPSFSTPIWINFANDRGLPISCNGTYFGDSVESIATGISEIAIMTKLGAGTSGLLTDIRWRGSPISTGGSAFGPAHFAEWIDSTVNNISQGDARRGNFGGYVSADHPDALEYLEIREEHHPIAKMSIGLTFTDNWMKEMIEGDPQKREVWLRSIRKKIESGYPYMLFTDNADRGRPQVYKDLGYHIRTSNLCTEIMLPLDEFESFVCNLSSLNLLYYHEWKNTDLIETMTYFLDAVMEEYIQKTKTIKYMERPNRFARRHRALGLGVLGWHSFLQSNMIAFDDIEAFKLNEEIFALMDARSLAATKTLASLFGEPEVMKGTGQRNATRLAIAPTKSSSSIIGGGLLSQGIEPIKDNYHVTRRAKITKSFKNPHLGPVLAQYGMDTDDVWLSILKNGGSIQHLDLPRQVKNVFRTFAEIDQRVILLQAAQRGRHLDQGQSTNLTVHPSTPTVTISRLHILAWRLGCKSLYYMHGANLSQEYARDAANDNKKGPKVAYDPESEECIACSA